jgi:carboxyl-terminal processing protease
MSKLVTEVSRKPRTVPLHTAILVTVFVGIVGFVTGTRSDEITARFSGTSSPSSLDFSSLDDVYSVLRAKYDGKLDAQALIDGAKHGLVEATGDPYTSYFTAKEAEQFESDLEGSFQGVGAELGKRNDQLVIISTLDDSPAKKAGLLANDVIVKVNDEDASKWTVEQAVSKIRGEKGTTVKLTVFRGEGLKDVSITRDAINNPSVKSEITPEGVGILRISRFGETDTVTLSRKAADQFKASGVKAIILDMRGNGGGYLSAARDVASLWLEDEIVVTERANNKIIDTLRSDNNAPLKGIKTIVLVDGGSASASEIVAGALADNGAATLVGTKTFGKGSVQIVEDVRSGGKIKITVAKWYTPNGKNITKEGLTPSVSVELTPEDVNDNRDPQKDKALELAR